MFLTHEGPCECDLNNWSAKSAWWATNWFLCLNHNILDPLWITLSGRVTDQGIAYGSLLTFTVSWETVFKAMKLTAKCAHIHWMNPQWQCFIFTYIGAASPICLLSKQHSHLSPFIHQNNFVWNRETPWMSYIFCICFKPQLMWQRRCLWSNLQWN